MKFALIIPDGCADEPQEQLGGKSPLEAAKTPAMDRVAATGLVALANHTPTALPAGSDTANLSLLGYDPIQFYTGRAPLEAAAQGIQLGPTDWAVRCNMVTIQDQLMRSFTAGQISTREAAALLESLQERVADPRLKFVPGVSYRNLLLVKDGPFSSDTRTLPPHDLTDQTVLDGYPRGPGSDFLCDIMATSEAVFADHPLNAARIAAGHPPATHVWLWGQGRAPQLPSFMDVYGKRGAMITAVDLLRGLAKLLGWQRIDVPGATGYLDTDYAAKGRYAIEALKTCDIVCVHVEATDEASHEGRVDAKMEALEQIDRHIVAPVFEALQSYPEWRILVSPDHPTPVRTKTHSHGDVPFAMAGTGIAAGGQSGYSERAAAASGVCFNEGFKVMGKFFG